MESFSAFVETALLLVTAVYIIWEAFQRLLFHTAHIRPSLLAILILALVHGHRFRPRARFESRRSEISQRSAGSRRAAFFHRRLEHLVVILGITGAWLGARYGIAWLGYAGRRRCARRRGRDHLDRLAARETHADALLDVAPPGLREHIAAAVDKTEGVMQSERVRVRRAGQRYFVDVTISVPRTASLEQAHAASDAVERRIAQIVPADVVVHVEPRAKTDEHLFETIRAIAQRRGLAVHELSAHQFEGPPVRRAASGSGRRLQPARSAPPRHRTGRRHSLKETEPRALVNIHIEPLGVKIGGAEEMKELSRTVQEFLNSLQSEYHELADCHEVHVRSVDHKILVSCHCAMDGSLPITEVHDITAALEDRVKERFPQIFRLTIHPEPVEES